MESVITDLFIKYESIEYGFELSSLPEIQKNDLQT